MKKSSRVVIIVLSIAMVITVASILAMALTNSKDNLVPTNIGSSTQSRLINVKNFDKFYTADGKSVTLSYKGLETTENKELLVYTDNSGYEYSYDSNGNFVMISIGDGTPITLPAAESTSLTYQNTKEFESKLIDAASKYATNIFGDEFKKLTGEPILVKAPSTELYNVRFPKTYGKDGSIIGPLCSVTFDKYLNVLSCSMPNGYVTDDIDEKSLNCLTQKDILDYSISKIEGIIGEMSDFSSEVIILESTDNGYVIKNIVKFLITEDIYSIHKDEIKENGYRCQAYSTDPNNINIVNYIVSAEILYPFGR